MELLWGKLLAALSLLFGTLIFSLLPVLLFKKSENKSSRPRKLRVVSFLSCFGGGVFMATCLLHLFPDVKEQMNSIFKSIDLNPNFPVAEFLLGVGFLLVLITEQIVLNFKENYGSFNESPDPIVDMSGSAVPPSVQSNVDHKLHTHEVSFHSHENTPIPNPEHLPAESHYQNYGSFKESPEQIGDMSDSDVLVPSIQSNEDHELHTNEVSFPSHENTHIPNPEHLPSESYYQNYGSFKESPEQIVDMSDSDVLPSVQSNEDHELHTHENSFHEDPSSHSILRSLLLVFALSLHSIFEGLAIGLQASVGNVGRILLAVSIHKCIIAFTLGLNLTSSKLQRSDAIKGIVLFSLTSPLGIIIGLVVVGYITGLPMMITSGILQGLAAGTFLYVTFFEILPHELNSDGDRMIKMGCLVLGFSVVSFLLILFPDYD